MSTNGSTLPKDDLLKQIWEICSTLTDEAMAAGLKKSKEQGFDPDRGIVPLQESLINLSSARNVLEDAIDNQKLVQLPITVQKEILQNLQAISKSLQGLSSGTDEIVNLSNSIEALNTSIWKYGFHNLSDEVLGYQKKLNQIKTQQVQLSKAFAELETAQKTAEQVKSYAVEIEQKKGDVATAVDQMTKNSGASASILEQMKEAGDKSSALYSTIQQQEKQSGELTSAIKTANNELLSLNESIRKFYGEVEDYRAKISQTSEAASGLIRTSEASVKKLLDDTTGRVESAVDSLRQTETSVTEELKTKIDVYATGTQNEITKSNAEMRAAVTAYQGEVEAKVKAALEQAGNTSSKMVRDAEIRLDSLETHFNELSAQTVEANQEKTNLLIGDLAKLKEQIREQIQQATGFRLFGAFQSRQNEISKAKNIWAIAIAVLVVISAGVTAWIAHEAQQYTVNSFAFWVKLSLTLPIAFAITFCTVQYGRERRLEEEYAFKSSISVSLNPYRDLIHSILKDEPTDQAKYADFVIDAVRSVFTPPTDRVFESEQKPGVTAKTFKQVAEIIGTAVKASK